jgi:hypothetical protein
MSDHGPSERRSASVALALFLWVVVLAGLAYGVAAAFTTAVVLIGG